MINPARHSLSMTELIIKPNPDDPRLTQSVQGIDQAGETVALPVVTERPLTLYLNGQEIVTMMTVGDHPRYLAVGYLLNQHMLTFEDQITAIDYDPEIDVVVVRTNRQTDFEHTLRKKTLTSGCAQGTAFGNVMDHFDTITLPPETRLKTSWIYPLSKKIASTPSLYLKAGAIHGCALCQRDQPLIYMEDVGRHNAIDKIAGYLFLEHQSPDDKILYTTGRLTSEMVIKAARMGIPVVISRSGFTAWGVELARQVNLTLIGRAKGKRFLALSGFERIEYDQNDQNTDISRKAGPL